MRSPRGRLEKARFVRRHLRLMRTRVNLRQGSCLDLLCNSSGIENSAATGGGENSALIFAIPLRTCSSPLWPATRPLHRGGALHHEGNRTMSDTPAEVPPRFLRTPEAASLVGLSGRTLEKH